MKADKDVINWLLEDDNPPVKYLTLKYLLNEREDSDQVLLTKNRLMEYEVTQSILDHTDEFLYEQNDHKRYWKYTGLYWQLIFLGQFLADCSDERVMKISETILNDKKWINQRGGQCLTANILRSFQLVGISDQEVVTQEIENLAQRIIDGNGLDCEVIEYSLLDTCQMAIAKVLLCFSEIPPSGRSSIVNQAITLLVNQMIENQVHKYVSSNHKDWTHILETAPKRKDLPKGMTVKRWIADQKEMFLLEKGFGVKTEKKGWVRFGFPMHYNSDILEGMYALAKLNVPFSKALETPLNIIKSKRTDDGIWKLENSLNGKMWVDVETKGEPSKWLTYFGLFVINHFGNNR